ncbi:hypothetical protein D9M70_421190 [compost metagenome]
MGAQQVHHDELARRRVGQDLLERRQYIVVVLARVLVAVVVQVELLIRLLGEVGEHGVALGEGLLIGNPVGLVAGLLHHVQQRRPGQVEIGVALIGEGQHLLQRLDGVGTRGDDVVEHIQLVADAIEIRRGRARVAVEAHALAVGGLAKHQHQGGRQAGVGILEIGQRRDASVAFQQVMHLGQLLAVLAVAHQQLPGHGRFHALLEAVAGRLEGLVAQPLLQRRIANQRRQQRQAREHRLAARQMNRTQPRPQQHGTQGIAKEGRHHPPGEILGQVLGAFRHVRFEHDEDDALGEFLAVDQEVAESRQGGEPEQQAQSRRNSPGTPREEQHRDQPQAAEQEGLAESAETTSAGYLDEELGNTREIPEEEEEPAEPGPVEPTPSSLV